MSFIDTAHTAWMIITLVAISFGSVTMLVYGVAQQAVVAQRMRDRFSDATCVAEYCTEYNRDIVCHLTYQNVSADQPMGTMDLGPHPCRYNGHAVLSRRGYDAQIEHFNTYIIVGGTVTPLLGIPSALILYSLFTGWLADRRRAQRYARFDAERAANSEAAGGGTGDETARVLAPPTIYATYPTIT